MASDAGTAISVHDLVVYYGERRILREVSMDVREGEIMVIMGGSGSGKSTLLRHLLGLERPRSGSIHMLGADITTAGHREMLEVRKKIGVAFQFGALLSSLSVGDNVMLPLVEHTRLDRRTMEVMLRLKLEVVGLAGFENLMPAELSGGMTKRAALARAIVMDPQLLFLDEPSVTATCSSTGLTAIWHTPSSTRPRASERARNNSWRTSSSNAVTS